MDPSKRYALSGDAVIRPEPFGGLVYRYDNRRLYFVHSKPMTEFLGGLDGTASLDSSIDRFLESRSLPRAQREPFLRALVALERMEVLREL